MCVEYSSKNILILDFINIYLNMDNLLWIMFVRTSIISL